MKLNKKSSKKASSTQLGLGVMINMLCGDNSAEILKECLNKKIKQINLVDDILHLEFKGGLKIKVWDDGQSCCEHRYMVCDDNLNEFIEGNLLGMEIKNAPNMGDEYDVHEVQFLDVKTSKGVFQLATHNEHNGYYGGFSIKIEKE